jgi:hypothetical protein
MDPSSAQGTLSVDMSRRSNETRIAKARARARSAKVVLVFGVAFAGAKADAPGHTKGKSTPLGAPKSFERAVKRSIAQGGQIAPAVQPPPVATSTS